MRIAQVCHRFLPTLGGVQVHVKEISERLVKKGFDLDILTTDPSGELPKEEILGGVHVKRFKSFAPKGSFYFSVELKRYLDKTSNAYDIVHAHNFQAFPATYAAEKKRNNKLIVTPHYHGHGQTFLSNLFFSSYKFFNKKVFEKADGVICVTEYEKSLVCDHFHVKEDKIIVIPNGINKDEFKGLKREKHQVKTILYVGRLEKYKGVHYLIQALKKLDDSIVLEIVGKGSFKKELAGLSGRLGLEKRVLFRQDLPRKDLLQSYINADLFALLSKYEACGITVLEALSSKTPCLVANTSALRELVDGKNCFGIDYPINVNELADVIATTLGKRISKLDFMSWDDVVSNLIGIYGEVLCA
jgi:glycosyltransferase involved in cell wall biosynthesis